VVEWKYEGYDWATAVGFSIFCHWVRNWYHSFIEYSTRMHSFFNSWGDFFYKLLSHDVNNAGPFLLILFMLGKYNLIIENYFSIVEIVKFIKQTNPHRDIFLPLTNDDTRHSELQLKTRKIFPCYNGTLVFRRSQLLKSPKGSSPRREIIFHYFSQPSSRIIWANVCLESIIAHHGRGWKLLKTDLLFF
jgi:hypothetical protein